VILKLDLIGGIAGDMFIAAVIDAFPNLESQLKNFLHKTFKKDIPLKIKNQKRNGIKGKSFDLNLDEHHTHKSYFEIKNWITKKISDENVRNIAQEIYKLIAVAEAKVHGKRVDSIKFHEVGEWDSLIDILSSAFLIEKLNSNWIIGKVPLGNGTVLTKHGLLPIPVPATCEILKKKFEFYDDGFDGERVTPTGAAIIRYLNDHLKTSFKPTILISSGYGLGSRKKTEYNNFLRLNAYKKDISKHDMINDQVVVLGFELDDQTAEDISIGIEKISNFDNVLDIIQYPVYSKKQRIATSLRVLCKLNEHEGVIEECFSQFNTLGIRYEIIKRLILPRKINKIIIDDKKLRIKKSIGKRVKIESDDLKKITSNQIERDNLRSKIK
jgi:uncharacterized protein (TIGR00299 family) protein